MNDTTPQKFNPALSFAEVRRWGLGPGLVSCQFNMLPRCDPSETRHEHRLSIYVPMYLCIFVYIYI